jgi:hypothetical protein
MSPSYTVFPMRFSAEPEAIIGFLEALGLQLVLDSESGTYAEFVAASGRVAVHDAADAAARVGPGDTSLNFSVADVDAAVAQLRGVGLTTSAWDESYGRQGVVSTPGGSAIGLNPEGGRGRDGFRVHEQTVAASLDVVAVRYSSDFRADAAFFGSFGFEPFGSLDDPWWCELRAGRRQGGVIGLHAPNENARANPPGPDAHGAAVTDRPALVRLGFETSEPLDALAARLQAAGYRASVAEDEAGTKVVVTDPDGQDLEIHPTI